MAFLSQQLADAPGSDEISKLRAQLGVLSPSSSAAQPGTPPSPALPPVHTNPSQPTSNLEQPAPAQPPTGTGRQPCHRFVLFCVSCTGHFENVYAPCCRGHFPVVSFTSIFVAWCSLPCCYFCDSKAGTCRRGTVHSHTHGLGVQHGESVHMNVHCWGRRAGPRKGFHLRGDGV